MKGDSWRFKPKRLCGQNGVTADLSAGLPKLAKSSGTVLDFLNAFVIFTRIIPDEEQANDFMLCANGGQVSAGLRQDST